MPRKSNIKWRKSDDEVITRAINRFNAKIYRTNYNHPELKEIQPETIKKADKEKMIAELKSLPRSEFNKTIKSLERYNKKGAEKIVVSDTGNKVTKWEKKEVSIQVGTLNRERTRERKRLENEEVTTRGKPTGLKRGEMGSERMNALKPKKFNFNKIKGGKEWEKFKESLKRQTSASAKLEKMEEYKKNYITAIERVYGEHGNDVIELLNQLPAEKVIETYYTEQEASIQFHYEPQEMQRKLDIITDIWQGVFDSLNETDS